MNSLLKNDDQNKNKPLLAISVLGKGWHHNRHPFPPCAKFGLRWWHIDLGYWFIKVLQWRGVGGDVKTPSQAMIGASKIL